MSEAATTPTRRRYGRAPLTPGEPSVRHLACHVPERLAQRAIDRAWQERTSVSRLLYRALENLLAEEPAGA